MRTLFTLLIALLLVGCASGEKIKTPHNFSLVRLQKLADTSLPVGRAKISRNGRVFYSIPFVTNNGQFAKAKDERQRRIAVIKVLGDSRPYTMEVQVVKEVLGPSGFTENGYDEGLARVISRRIQKALVQRREDRNIIDDFKAF